GLGAIIGGLQVRILKQTAELNGVRDPAIVDLDIRETRDVLAAVDIVVSRDPGGQLRLGLNRGPQSQRNAGPCGGAPVKSLAGLVTEGREDAGFRARKPGVARYPE